MDAAQLTERLERFCRKHSGDGGALVGDLEEMPGHAGFSYGFTLTPSGGEEVERLVLRLSPPGTRHRGTADIAGQGRLIEALEPTDVPVPAVRWYGDEPRWFDGSSYYVVERLPGATVVETLEREPVLAPDAVRAMAEQTIAALAALHRLDQLRHAPHLGEPLPAADDLERWDGFWERAAEPDLVVLGPELKARLKASAPAEPRMGIFHGDFQWGNVMFDGEGLVGVLDWELAGAGAVLNDLGWLLVFSDPESWVNGLHDLTPLPSPHELTAIYADAWGGDSEDIAWYRALAGYKFSIISGFNLMLHRRGKRPDPLWEELEPSIPRLMERGLEVLEDGGR